MPQITVKIKDIKNNRTNTVAVFVTEPAQANAEAMSVARKLLGHAQLEVVRQVQYKPYA